MYQYEELGWFGSIGEPLRMLHWTFGFRKPWNYKKVLRWRWHEVSCVIRSREQTSRKVTWGIRIVWLVEQLSSRTIGLPATGYSINGEQLLAQLVSFKVQLKYLYIRITIQGSSNIITHADFFLKFRLLCHILTFVQYSIYIKQNVFFL